MFSEGLQKNSVETGSYSEAVFGRFFLAPAFSIKFGLWRFTCVFSFLASTNPSDFWQAMTPPLHDWRFWFCVFLDTHAQIFQPSLVHACDQYALCGEAFLFIYALISIYVCVSIIQSHFLYAYAMCFKNLYFLRL